VFKDCRQSVPNFAAKLCRNFASLPRRAAVIRESIWSVVFYLLELALWTTDDR
jgi:hypothetical protein